MSPLRAHTSRRTSLVLVCAAPMALAACELDRSSSTSATRRSTTEPTPRLPDTDVVSAARAAINTLVAAAESVTARHPRLGRELGPWLSLHTAHLEVLGEGSGDESSEPLLPEDPPAPRAAAARARFLRDEDLLATSLADLAQQAASGDLARALASMSAAVSQRVTS